MVKAFLIWGLFMFLGSEANAYQADSSNTVLTILFRDNFRHDIASLRLNKKTILKDELLDSNTSGFANIQIDLIKSNTNTLAIIYLNKKVSIPYTNRIDLILTLNGKQSHFTARLSKGKYVEFSKKDKSHFYFDQTKVATIWD